MVVQFDTVRHDSVFSDFNRRVDIIGCGATGSRVAMSLARLGVYELHLWDKDTVSDHNIANQIFDLPDVGLNKVLALAIAINRATKIEPIIHEDFADSKSQLGHVVFILTDTMQSRKDIFSGLKGKFGHEVVIETRMGIKEGRIYVINPMSPKQVDFWSKTLYNDDEAQESYCGSRIVVGATADVLAGLSVWQFITWWNDIKKGDSTVFQELIFGLYPFGFLTNKIV